MFHSRRRGFKAAALTSAVLLGLAACGPSAADPEDDADAAAEGAENGEGTLDPDTIVLGAVPAEEATDLQGTWEPIMEMLADETGKEVEFEMATDYAAVIEGQRSGQVHIAQYGPFAYYMAVEDGVELSVGGVMIQEEGEPGGYQAYGITQAGSGIESLEDFEDQTVCFVDPNSASGFMVPQAGLIEAGLEEGSYEEVMAGGHDASAISVASGDCDAGFALDSMVDETLIESGDLEEGELEIVWESDMIPSPPLVVSDQLEPELHETIMTALAENANIPYLVENGYCESEDDCDISDQRVFAYEPVPEDYFDSLAEVCEITQAPQCEDPEA
jgi:phosphonate transport system substrate-binding protein